MGISFTDLISLEESSGDRRRIKSSKPVKPAANKIC
jgi:hypothetical protein